MPHDREELEFRFSGGLANLKSLLCGLFNCHRNRRLWIVSFDPDERIPRNKMRLSKPIKPGFRRPCTITPDEAVDQRADGTFAQIEVLSGDSQVVYNPASTATSIQVWFNGDGSLGDKSARLTVDGHVGDGDVPISLDVDWTVASPDATTLGFVEGTDEPIP